MAQLVLSFGSSHGPTIATLPEQWDRMAERDKHDPRYRYDDLLSRASPSLVEEITLEKKRARYEAAQTAISRLATMLAQAAPDVAIVISDPHSILPDDMLPVFGIFRGATLSSRSEPRAEGADDPRMARYRGPAAVQTSRPQRAPHEYPSCPELADHLIDSLIDEGFDVASTLELRREHGLDEAFRAFYEHYQSAGTVPMLPLSLSRYLPSQPTPRRCYAFGRALRRAIDSWAQDKRVVLMASGGLSHQIIDRELDDVVVDALTSKDAERLCSLPRERLNGAPGTPEILNWVTVAAAMEPVAMTLVDYVPCYRSPAGTGHGLGFGYWTP
jgi:3-O-methylgallate 3,4-dioxygenase